MCEGFNFSMFLLMPIIIWASQVVLMVKNPPAGVGDIRDTGSIPGVEDPLEKEMATHSVFLPGKFHGQRSLVGNHPIGL